MKNTKVLIGRSAADSRLMLCYETGGQKKTACVGTSGSVPQSVSRCIPEQGVAHCLIEADGDGQLTVKNLKEQNITYVDGMEVLSKRIKEDSTIGLGSSRYPVKMSEVIKLSSKLFPPPPPEYDILPLKKVWEDYHEAVIKIKKRQRKLNLIRSSSGIFSFGSGAVNRFNSGSENKVLQYVTGGIFIIGAMVFVLSFILGYKDKSIEEGERLMDEFQDKYVCPNPECRHFIGTQPYKIVRQNKACPYCHAKWREGGR